MHQYSFKYSIYVFSTIILFACKAPIKENTESTANDIFVVENLPIDSINNQNIETAYQQIWETAIREKDFSTMDTLLSKKRRFGFPEARYYSDSPLDDLFRYSWYKNWQLWNQISLINDELKIREAESYFLTYKEDSITGMTLRNFNYDYDHPNDPFFMRENPQQKETELTKTLSNIEQLKITLEELTKEAKSNLDIMTYTLDKGYKLNDDDVSRLIYGGDDTDYYINEISTPYFYDNIYPHTVYFSDEIDLECFSPTEVFSQTIHLSAPMSDEIISYFLSKNINKSFFFEKIYPDVYDPDNELPPYLPYMVEKQIMRIWPEIQEISGHTLLHAAIINGDILEVKKILKQNHSMIYVKTNPKHVHSYKEYGKTPYTPLELANYAIDKGFGLYQQQVKKIIECLQQETSGTELSN